MLNRYRKKADKWLEPLARRAGVKADTLSYLSFLFAIFAGISLYLSGENRLLFLLAALFILINGFFDALDGKIARIRGTSSLKGDFIDHSIDRFADAFMIGGIALSSWCSKEIGVISLAAVILTSYMGTQAQAVGYKRVYGGMLGRADRIVLLFLASLLQYFFNKKIFGYYLLEWMLMYFIFAGIITILQRYYATIKWFEGGKK